MIFTILAVHQYRNDTMRKIILLILLALSLVSCGPGQLDSSFEIISDYYLTDLSGDQKYITKGKWGIMVIEPTVVSFTVDDDEIYVLRELTGKTWADSKAHSWDKVCEIYIINIKEETVNKIDADSARMLFRTEHELDKPLVYGASSSYKCLNKQ